ncbi:glycosyltransferase [Streptomyces sp. NPDC059443]|uniref:MGDG synthase family glycosyltransferase n=1 Tax=unclassified Streptomyces TaxID=2593676 RepID=UPI0036948300
MFRRTTGIQGKQVHVALHDRSDGNASDTGAGTVVIISASVGAGHDGAAAELTRRLTLAGVGVTRHDFLDLLPPPVGRLLNASYHRMLEHAPWMFERIYAATDRPGGGRPAATALRAAEARTLAALPPGTRAVVSTYPLASQVLGALRRDGRLSVPTFTYLTDFSVHPTWVADGIDVHLAAHPVPAEQARRAGAARVRTTFPVVAPEFAPASGGDRATARARFGLPATEPLALLVAGSWGVGDVARTASEIRAGGVATPVVVCGRNERLARRLRLAGVEHVLTWVADMPSLMRAADVLVQNAGGLTSLEAFASGLPVISYNCIPGHGRTNAAALEEAGLAPWVRRAEDLSAALSRVLLGAEGTARRAAGLALFDTPPDSGPDAAVRSVLTPAPRATRDGAGSGSGDHRPTGIRRARGGSPRRRAAAAALTVAVVAGVALTAPESTEAAVAHSSWTLLHVVHR